jgi:hypothetical protein
LVDYTDHTSLAVARESTVEPYRLSIVDSDGKCRWLVTI